MISESSNNFYENGFTVLCEIMDFAFTESTGKLQVVEHLLMFHNIKITTKSDVFS